MSLPTSEKLHPDDSSLLPPARRRRMRRSLAPGGSDDRAVFLEELSRRVTPSADFFLFSMLAGLALAAALLFDAPALFVMAALLSPFLGPVVGLSLATSLGSIRFFASALGGMLLGSLFVFLAGAGAGLVVRYTPGPYLALQAGPHAYFTWPDFALLTLGAVLTTYLIVRAPRQRPLVASVALAYEIFLPVGAAGFGLAAGRPGLWPDGLLVFIAHFGWAVLAGALVLAVMGFRPVNFFGYTLGTSCGLAALAALLLIGSFGTALGTHRALPPVPPTLTPTITHTLPPSLTSPPPSGTPSPTHTLVPSRTPTISVTPKPTPVFARINAGEFNGALIRKDPNSNAPVVKSLLNGMLVEVLPEVQQNGGVTWAHVRISDGIEGWIVRGLLVTATPQPGW